MRGCFRDRWLGLLLKRSSIGQLGTHTRTHTQKKWYVLVVLGTLGDQLKKQRVVNESKNKKSTAAASLCAKLALSSRCCIVARIWKTWTCCGCVQIATIAIKLKLLGYYLCQKHAKEVLFSAIYTWFPYLCNFWYNCGP